MNTEIPIGIRIKKLRESQGMTVKAFALKHEINQDNLYKWEKGTKPSDPEDFLKLENTNLNCYYFFSGIRYL